MAVKQQQLLHRRGSSLQLTAWLSCTYMMTIMTMTMMTTITTMTQKMTMTAGTKGCPRHQAGDQHSGTL